MDATVVISGVSACGAFIAAVAAITTVLKTNELHLTMNSRLDQLLLASMAQARGEGHAAGMAESKIDPAVTAEAAAKVLETAQVAAHNVKE